MGCERTLTAIIQCEVERSEVARVASQITLGYFRGKYSISLYIIYLKSNNLSPNITALMEDACLLPRRTFTNKIRVLHLHFQSGLEEVLKI